MTIHDLKELAETFTGKGNDDMEVRLVLCQTHCSLEFGVGEVGLDKNGNLRLETGNEIGYAGDDIEDPW